MSTATIQKNVILGLGEASNITNDTFKAFALRWANRAYREIYTKAGYKFKNLNKRSIFRTSNGQQTYHAPADFIGFLTIRDETNNSVIDQITPEEFGRDVYTNKTVDESTTSSFDVAVDLSNKAILQYSEKVTTADGLTSYIRDTDYTISYTGGNIKVLSTGNMLDATEYLIDYLYWTTGDPVQFSFEYSTLNSKYVFRLDPVPDSEFIVSLTYPHQPDALSDSANASWNLMELAIESGGIYYGSLELIEDPQKRAEFKAVYQDTVSDLVKLDQDLVPKHDRIPVFRRGQDYTNRDIRRYR
jgi:hypothetical protein